MDDGRTLCFVNAQEVRYANFTSGFEGMTMLVRISGGTKAIIKASLMIFKKKNRGYPMRNIPYYIPEVAYRTQRKGSKDLIDMFEWLCETRVVTLLPNGNLYHLYSDNCSGHNLTEELLGTAERVQTTLNYIPLDTTKIAQPCDALVIQKIKVAW